MATVCSNYGLLQLSRCCEAAGCWFLLCSPFFPRLRTGWSFATGVRLSNRYPWAPIFPFGPRVCHVLAFSLSEGHAVLSGYVSLEGAAFSSCRAPLQREERGQLAVTVVDPRILVAICGSRPPPASPRCVREKERQQCHFVIDCEFLLKIRVHSSGS